MEIEYDARRLSLNGNVQENGSISDYSESGNYPIIIGGVYHWTSNVGARCGMPALYKRTKFVRISTGEVLGDFFPVKHRQTGVCGFFDAVKQQFHPSLNSVPFTENGNLTYDAEVEYLAGSIDRTAYINTGICPTSAMKIEAEISRTGTSDYWFFNTESYFYNTTSTNTTGDCFGLGWNYPRINYGGGYSSKESYAGFPINTKIKFEFQGGKSWMDG